MNDDLIISYATSFRGLRVFGRFIQPTNWSVRAEVLLQGDASDLDINLTFSRLNFFFQEIVNDSIFIGIDNRWAAKSLRKAENNIVLVPAEPTDNMLAPVFSAKMNALATEAIEIGAIEVDSDSGTGLSFVFTGHPAAYLPSMADWMGEGEYFAEQPWWYRGDGSTMDAPSKGTAVPDFVHDLSFLTEQFSHRPTPAAVIRPDFKPTLIRGSLDDAKQ